MTCPNCGYDHLKPYHHTHPIRRYKCWECGFRFETVEQVRGEAQKQAFQATLFEIVNGGKTNGLG